MHRAVVAGFPVASRVLVAVNRTQKASKIVTHRGNHVADPLWTGCSHWVYRASSSSASSAKPAGGGREVGQGELKEEGGFDFLDEGECGLEMDEAKMSDVVSEGDEIQQGVFVSHVEPKRPYTVQSEHRDTRPRPPSSIKQLNRLLSRHRVPDLDESELDEKFVKGRGPGGQAINKTNSSVSLIHIPTGIRVQSQPTRSRETNRLIARQILKERLDLMRAKGELPPSSNASGTGSQSQTTAGETKVQRGEIGQEKEKVKRSRKEELAELARTWSKQELRWEKERRRKLNRKKKVKKRDKMGNEVDEEEEVRSVDGADGPR